MRRQKKCAPIRERAGPIIKSMPTRVLTPGLLAGIRPVPDASELTTFDLGLYGGADVRPVTGIRDPSYGVDIPLPPAPRLLPAAINKTPCTKCCHGKVSLTLSALGNPNGRTTQKECTQRQATHVGKSLDLQLCLNIL